MDNIFFDADVFEVQIENLKNEYVYLEDIYDRFICEVVSKSDKTGEFKNKANEIREDLLRIEEQILSLKNRAVSIKNHYVDVEELNLHLVDNLPTGMEIMNKSYSTGRRPSINTHYRVVNDDATYVANKNYDFEDWLIEWLKNRESRVLKDKG
ncbi:MAG: hypothetical protein J5929_01185 [Eubacterium sp.]|nr:hypothetical protein [Eubacterium sp.]